MCELANDNIVYTGEVILLIIMVIGSLLLVSIIIVLILIKCVDCIESFIDKRKLKRTHNISVDKVAIVKFDGKSIYIKIDLINDDKEKNVIKE